MVLITEEQGEGAKVRENGVTGHLGLGEFRTNKYAMDTPTMSITSDESGDERELSEEDDDTETEVDYTRLRPLKNIPLISRWQ